jgi:hypothetical protein
MRDMMAQIRDCGDGIRDGTYTMTAPKITGGTITGAAFTGNTFTSPVISGGSINNTPIGATTANTGAFTTLSATGVTTVQAGSVSAPAITTSGDTNTGIFFPAADTIAFTEGGTESMRIDSSGNVQIGGTFGGKLCVAGSFSKNTGDENTWGIRINDDTAMAAGVGGGIVFSGAYTSGGGRAAFGAIAGAKTNSTTSNGLGELRFYTTDVSSILQERMLFDSSGNLLVVKTAESGTTQVIFLQGNGIYGFTKNESGTGPLGYFINANGTVDNGYRFASFRVTSGFTEVGTITTNGSSTTAYNTSSDYRLKENIAPMTGALATVSALKPVTYKWKIDGSAGQGFIAHELAEVVPDCVTGEKDAVDEEGNPQYQGIDTSFLVATLTAAIQEQQALIENLTTRLNALEGN